MTIHVQPEGNIYALSPVIYHISDTNNGTANFEYVLDVYIWNGDSDSIPASPSFTLTKLPDSNGSATFDISYLIRASLVPQQVSDFIFVTDDFVVDSSNQHTQWVHIKASYWTDGSTKTATTGSNVRLAQRGYALHEDGVNSDYSDEDTFTKAVSGMYIPRGLPFAFSCDTNTIDSVSIVQNNNSGVTYDLSSRDDTLNTKRFVTIVADDLNSSTTGGGYMQRVTDDGGTYPTATESCISEYLEELSYLTITTSTSSTTAQTWTLNVSCEPEYTAKYLAFLNRFGAWDFLPVVLNKIEGVDVERSEYKNNYLTTSASDATFTASNPVSRIHEVRGVNTITLNTGYQPEGIFELIQDLMLSERVTLIEGSTAKPLKVTDSNATKQTHRNERLVNYTINCEVAHPIANTITL